MATGILSIRRRDLADASEILGKEIQALAPPVPLAGPPIALEQQSGLPSLVREIELRERLDRLMGWCNKVDAARQGLSDVCPVFKATLKDPRYQELLASLALQQARRGRAYADPRAEHGLLDATLIALGTRARYRETGEVPRNPGADDWRKVQQAIDTLIELQGQGISLQPEPVQTQAWLPPDWLNRLRAKVTSSASSAPRPHSDKKVIERAACRTFVECMYYRFEREVPPVLVEKFGYLIDYQSPRLTRFYLKVWLQELAP